MGVVRKKTTSLFLVSTILSSLVVNPQSVTVFGDVTKGLTDKVSKAKLKKTLDSAASEAKKNQKTTFEEKVKAQLKAKGLTVPSSSSELQNKTVTVIVELDKKAASQSTASPTGSTKSINLIDKATQSTIQAQKPVRDQVATLTGNKPKKTFGYLLNGFSINAKVSDISAIQAIKGVKAVTPANVYAPQDQSANEIANVPQVWSKYKLKGEGTLIAIIDSGIDPTHKDLTLDNNSSEKLTQSESSAAIQKFGYGKWYSDKVPFAYNYADGTSDTVYDTGASEMHGMHVAGIVAANGKATAETGSDTTKYVVGVAPNAQLLDMKVFSNNGGGAYSDDIVSAIEDSVKLGANVINMSLGSVGGNQDQDDPEQEAVNQAAKEGVVPVISAGNNGLSTSADATNNQSTSLTNDNGTVGSPGVAADAITVASSENTTMVSPWLDLTTASGAQTLKDPLVTQLSDKADLTKLNGKALYLAKNGSDGLPGVGNAKDFDSGVKGKVAVVMRGSIAFTEKQENALNAGAAGLIIINNKPDETALNFSMNTSITTMAILYNGGQSLLAYVKDHSNQTYNFVVKNLTTPNASTGKMSTFSSYGPTPDLTLKPDVTAPGGQIWSTANNNSYQEMSGTSMASPFTAGVSALVTQSLSGSVAASNINQYVKTDLMNTAVPLYDKDHPDAIVSPRRQGAGLVQVDKAVDNKVFATTTSGDASISLKEITSNTQTMTVQLTNNGKDKATYSFNKYGGVWTNSATSQQNAYDDKLSGAAINLASATNRKGANVLDSNQEITVAASDTVTVKIKLTLPQQTTNSYVEGYIGFQAENNGVTKSAQNLVVPYLGYYGQWNSQKIFDDPIWTGNSYYGTSYSMDGEKNILGLNAKGDNITPSNIAFSPNFDDSQDTATPIVSLWRNAKNLTAQIYKNDPDDDKNANQKPIRTLYIDPEVTKTYYNTSTGSYTSYTGNSLGWDGTVWNAKTGQYDTATDGQYYYKISAESESGSTDKQSQTLPIKLDTVAPTIDFDKSSLSVDSDGTYHLKATLKDELSGIASFGKVVVAINGVSATYDQPLSNSHTLKQAIDVTLKSDQVSALQAGKNSIQIAAYDNAGNFGDAEELVQAPDKTTYGLVLYDLNDNEVITTNSAIYHRRYNTITLMGSYPSNFYVNGKLVEVDPQTQVFDMTDSKNGIPLPEDGKFIFSTDEAGKNVIRVVQTRISVTEPVIHLDHANEKLSTDQTTFNMSGTLDDLDSLDTLVVGNLSTNQITNITKNVKSTGDNKGSFSADVPLQFGDNTLVAQAADKDGNVDDVVKFTVNSSADAQFMSDPSSVISFDNDLNYGLNVVSSTTSSYDKNTQTLTISGHLKHAVDDNGLMIGETAGPKRTVVNYDPKTLTFETKIKAAPNTKVSVPVQVKYQGQNIVDNSLQFYIDTTLPDLSLFDESSLQRLSDGSYQIKTNQSPYQLSGSANDNYDGFAININGDMIENQKFSFIFSKGNNGQMSQFNVPLDLTTGDNIADITVSDAVGNQTSKKVNVRYYKATLDQPIISASTTAPTNKSVSLTAEAAKLTTDAPNDDNIHTEYSLDQGKSWIKYNDHVAIGANTKVEFKSVDDYGNESAVITTAVTNIVPQVESQATISTRYDAAHKTAVVSLGMTDQLPNPDVAGTSLQYSLDEGKTWQAYQKPLTIAKKQVVQARTVDKAGNIGRVMTVTLFADNGAKPSGNQKPSSNGNSSGSGSNGSSESQNGKVSGNHNTGSDLTPFNSTSSASATALTAKKANNVGKAALPDTAGLITLSVIAAGVVISLIFMTVVTIKRKHD